MTFARRVFLTAGVYGVLIIAPQFFLATKNPQPELYYGFLGAVLSWNLAYLVVAADPARYRPLMLLGSLGKTIFAVSALILWLQARVPTFLLAFAGIDVVIVAFYLESWRRTAPAPAPEPAEGDVLVLDLGTRS